jgi:multidrug efflux system outer membrane protein
MAQRLLALGVLALALGGCVVGPDYQRPAVALPGDFAEPAQAQAPALAPEWWKAYGDATLDALEQKALAGNTDVLIAAARLEEAEAVLRQARASLFPQIDLGGAGTRSRVSTSMATPVPPGVAIVRDDFRVAASTAFEIDFWGKLRRATEAAQAQALASGYGREVVRWTLAGTVAQAYFALRSLDAQVAVLRDSLVTREEALDVVSARAEAGIASDLDMNQARGARADAAAQLKELQRQRALVEHQLAVLSGDLALRLPPGALESLPVPPPMPAGLPSELLERRPDIRVAEQDLVAANAQIGIAKAALFPTISLTGSLGAQSGALDDLLVSGSRIWSAGFGLALPIFDAGRNLARVDQAEARRRQVLFGYQRAVETAFREVSDAIANVRQAGLAEGDLRDRVAAARNSEEIARLRYQSGYSAYLDVLDAQRTANEAELALVRNRQARLAYSVDFIKALGGGWTPGATGHP